VPGFSFWTYQPILAEVKMAAKSKKQRKTVIFIVYLFRRCHRAQQEGTIRMKGQNRAVPINHLDEIPRKIRHQLAAAGLTYDVDDNSDDTVITQKRRKRRVIRKIRLGDR